jgi:hypothetical protein
MKKDLGKVKKRKRRTNLELAGISRVHLRLIEQTSQMIQVPSDKVWADVVEIGVAGVLASYTGIMKTREQMESERKLRKEHIKSLFRWKVDPPHILEEYEPKPSEPTGPGSPEEQIEVAGVKYAVGTDPGHSDGPSADDSSPGSEGSVDHVVVCRYSPEADEIIGSVDPNGAITIG